jgi:hypothetical protein
MAVQIQLRRDTASNWTTNNPTLAEGEFAIETDTDKYKIGDGSTAWGSLSYSSLPSTSISNTTIDAKGDVLAGTADNTITRLGVGTNGQVLTADSTAATGLAWAADNTTDTTKMPLAGGTFTGAVTFDGASPIVLEGATADGFETTVAVTDPTADQTITLPDATGMVALADSADLIISSQVFS